MLVNGWQIATSIAALITFIIALIKPILALTKSITELTDAVKNIQCDMQINTTEHKEFKEQLGNHETRIYVLESNKTPKPKPKT